MSFHPSQSAILMPHSLTVRVAAAVGEALRAARNAFQQTWHAGAAQSARANSFELMADIDAHTLRDIGAPNWLIAHAVERRVAHRFHLLDLYRS